MTYPTFTNGQVLPASDLNAIGLWLVKTQTIAASSSIAVTSAFSSDYNAYRIVMSGFTNAASDIALLMTLNGSAGATYKYWSNFWQYGAAAGNASSAGTTSWICGWSSTAGGNLSMDIINPNLATQTAFNSANSTTSYYMAQGGIEASNNQHTGFTIACGSAFNAGGTIRVYGYRN